MWVYTMARRDDGRMFVLDLNHLGAISVTGPHSDSGEAVWAVEASDGSVSWVLAEAPSHVEAVSIQRRIFNALAIGDKAINLNASKRQSLE